jgi:hypothetical protein
MIKRWMLKAWIQKSLSFTPMGEKINKGISVMRGSGLGPKFETKILNQAGMIGILGQFKDIEGATVIEVGVGRAPVASMLFFLAGAERVIGLDRIRLIRPTEVKLVTESLRKNLQSVKRHLQIVDEQLEKRFYVIQSSESLEELKRIMHFDYLAPTDASNTAVARGAVDIVYTNGVLEHVPALDLWAMVLEHRRILGEAGIAFHSINLVDHYRTIDKNLSGVNFLQYSDRFWETFVNSSIHYQNRLRKSDYLRLFERAGAEILYCKEHIRDADLVALETMKIAPRFRGYSARDLAVHRLDVVLRYQ